MCSSKNGFTLIEVLAASMIGVFVALVAIGTLKAVSISAEVVDANIRTAAEVRFASNMITNDLVNLYRGRNMKLIGTIEQTDTDNVGHLTFYTIGERFGFNVISFNIPLFACFFRQSFKSYWRQFCKVEIDNSIIVQL